MNEYKKVVSLLTGLVVMPVANAIGSQNFQAPTSSVKILPTTDVVVIGFINGNNVAYPRRNGVSDARCKIGKKRQKDVRKLKLCSRAGITTLQAGHSEKQLASCITDPIGIRVAGICGSMVKGEGVKQFNVFKSDTGNPQFASLSRKEK